MTEPAEDVLRELARLATDLGPALAPPGHIDLLRSVTAVARDLFDAASASIALVDLDEEVLIFTAATGAGAEKIVGTTIPLGTGIAGWVVASGQPILISDVEQDPRFARDVAARTGYVPRSILAMPLEGQHDTLGVLSILDPGESQELRQGGMDLLALLAQQATLAVEQSLVFGALGRVLFRAAGLAVDGTDLRSALEQVAEDTPRPDAQLARLTSHLQVLVHAGQAEQRAAAELLGALAAYVQGRSPQ
jgi:GAF domain-containing protein